MKNNTKNDKISTFLMGLFGCEACWWLFLALKFRVGNFIFVIEFCGYLWLHFLTEVGQFVKAAPNPTSVIKVLLKKSVVFTEHVPPISLQSMYRLLGILFILLYGAETLLCPLQDFSVLKSLPQTYSHCKAEDPDMNAADFVFEHLMNLGCIMSYFDQDSDEDGDEKPHHPPQPLQSISQTLIVVSRPLVIEAEHPLFSATIKKAYPAPKSDFFPSDFPTEVFRPPANWFG